VSRYVLSESTFSEHFLVQTKEAIKNKPDHLMQMREQFISFFSLLQLTRHYFLSQFIFDLEIQIFLFNFNFNFLSID